MRTRQHGEGFVGRIEAETVVSGIIAGAIMAGLESMASLVAGHHVLLPFRYAASIVMGRDALETGWLSVFIVGALVHFSIATMFAFAYGVLSTELPLRARVWGAGEAMMGMFFATVAWLLDFQLIARFFYPWMLDHSQPVQWWLHAVGFGLPLGLLFAAREKALDDDDVMQSTGGPRV